MSRAASAPWFASTSISVDVLVRRGLPLIYMCVSPCGREGGIAMSLLLRKSKTVKLLHEASSLEDVISQLCRSSD